MEKKPSPTEAESLSQTSAEEDAKDLQVALPPPPHSTYAFVTNIPLIYLSSLLLTLSPLQEYSSTQSGNSCISNT